MSGDTNISLSGQRVFVTGASGFIGRRVVGALLAVGASVTTLSRSRRTRVSVDKHDVTRVIGSTADGALMQASLKSQDILVNLAYDVRASGAENLAAFETLIDAAERAGIKRIVHTSSIVVYDGWPNQDLDEACTSEQSGGGPYRQTKIKMERRLQRGPIPAAILQPTIVYGPDSSLWTDQFARALMTAGIVLPDPVGLCNGVFVDDVAQAVVCAATVADLGQEEFIISGPSAFGWPELLNGYAKTLGQGSLAQVPVVQLRARLGPVVADDDAATPGMAARISAVGRNLIGQDRFEALVRRARQRLTKPQPMYPDHHLLGVFSATGSCSIALAKKRLGYEPQFDLAKGLQATEAHLLKLPG